jgi:hypothetical protein
MRSDKGIKEAVQLESHPPILERILAFAYEKTLKDFDGKRRKESHPSLV